MDFAGFQKRLKKFKTPVGSCLHVDIGGIRCKNRPIASHSLQKSVALKGIANGGHVYSLHPSFTPEQAEIEFDKIGYSKASTFPGYCKRHDAEVFAEIEAGYCGINDRALAILTLRSLAREYVTKLAQIRMFDSEDVRRSVTSQSGKPFYDEFMLGCHLAKKELENLKCRLEAMIHTNDFSEFLEQTYLFDDPLPFSFAASFSPEHSVSGEPILPAFRDEWGVVFGFCGRVGSDNVFALTSLNGQADTQIEKFFASLNDDRIEPRKFALNLGLEYMENMFFSVDWVDGLPNVLRKQIASKMLAGTSRLEPHLPEGYFELDHSV